MNFLKSIPAGDESDESLVQRYQATGNMDALAEVFQRYMELIYGVCLKYLKDPEASKDAVMQVFETLVVKLKNHDVAHFKAWLYVLTRNHCLMALRQDKKMKFTDIDPVFMQSAEERHLNGVLEREENLDRLSACLETLPAGQKEVVQLFYLEQQCYKDISDKTGQPWNQVRSLIQNGRRNLKNCMEKKSINQSPEKPVQ